MEAATAVSGDTASDDNSDDEGGGGGFTFFFIPCVLGSQTIVEAT